MFFYIRIDFGFCVWLSSGVSEEEMSDLKNLLTSVSKLEEAKPELKLKLNELYSKKDKDEAQAIRASALVQISSDSDSELDELHRNKPSKPKKAKLDLDFGRGRSMSPDPKPSTSSNPGPQLPDDRRTNPKKDLVKYLENKAKVMGI